jgi:hypothetical protein
MLRNKLELNITTLYMVSNRFYYKPILTIHFPVVVLTNHHRRDLFHDYHNFYYQSGYYYFQF